jgi:mannose/fructose-specific phosphotransferase system component IIA
MKLLFASHGGMAEGLLSSLRLIAGEEFDAEAFGLYPGASPDDLAAELEKRIEAAGAEHVTILCDIKGGSVCNKLLPLCERPNVSLICGMNMNMALVMAMSLPEDDPRAVQEEAIQAGKELIQYFDSDVLAELKKQEQEDGLW